MTPSGETSFIEELIISAPLNGGRSDTLGVFRGRQVVAAFIAGMPQPLSIPWGSDGVWVFTDDRLYSGTPEAPQLVVRSLDGAVTDTISWEQNPTPVTDADYRLYARKREHWLKRFPQLRDIILPLDRFPYIPATKPLFVSIIAGSGEVWLRTYPRHLAGRPDLYDWDKPLYEEPGGTFEPEQWLIFDSTNVLRAIANVPARSWIRGIMGGRLLLVQKGPNDEERIRLLEVSR